MAERGQRVTQRELARRLGISPAAVSQALRGSEEVSSTTRDKVRKLATELGYRLDPKLSETMRQLRQPGPHYRYTLAYLSEQNRTQMRESGWGTKLYEGVRRQAEDLGCAVNLVTLEPTLAARDRLAGILEARGVRGVVLGPWVKEQGRFPLSLPWERYALVAIGHHYPHLHPTRVVADHFTIFMQAIERLAAQGLRRIAMCAPESEHARQRHRLRGEWFACQECFKHLEIVDPHIERDYGPDRFLRWFETTRPEAIVALEPPVRGWLEAAGYQVPGDVALLQAQNGPQHDGTGFTLNFELMGAMAVSMLYGALERGERGWPTYPSYLAVPGCWREDATAN